MKTKQWEGGEPAKKEQMEEMERKEEKIQMKEVNVKATVVP